MWASLPSQAREFIYEHNLPLKIARVDKEFDLPEQEIRVAGIARRDDELLFVRSCREGREWEFPGGRIDEGETPTEAVRREFTEETGLDVTDADPLLALVWAFRDSTIVQIVFHIDATGDLQPSDQTEVCDIGWFETIPDSISFGNAGHQTYEVIINSKPVTVAFSDDPHERAQLRSVPDKLPNKKSIAVGGAVAGGAVAAGLARRLLTKGNDD